MPTASFLNNFIKLFNCLNFGFQNQYLGQGGVTNHPIPISSNNFTQNKQTHTHRDRHLHLEMTLQKEIEISVDQRAS